MMYASVVPALRLPKKFTAFDYAVPADIAPTLRRGDVVRVAFGGRRCYGIVFEIKQKSHVPAERIKPITEVLRGVKFLEKDMNALLEVRRFTNSSLPLIVKTFLPS